LIYVICGASIEVICSPCGGLFWVGIAMKTKLLGAVAALAWLSFCLAGPANALTVTIDPNKTVTSTPGAVTFYNFDAIQNTSIGTFSGGQLNALTPPDGGNFISAGQDIGNVTLTLVNPVSYIGFAWGTPDATDHNEVDVYNGATLLGTFFGDHSFFPNTYFFNITAGPGEAITSLVLIFRDPDNTTGRCCFETDNYATIAAVPLPGALPLFATGLGALGLLGWRRKRKLAAS
jgi:hypothetical protein